MISQSIHKSVRGDKPCVKQVGWTLLTLLVLMLATEMAEAQTAPSTKPQPQNVVAQPTKAIPASSGGAASKAGLGESIDKNKCTDIGNSEKLVREEIIKRVRDSVKNGAHPSLAYENVKGKTTLAAKADSRATAQAESLAGALFAAVKNPGRPANAASERLTGNSNRRATLEMFVRCTENDSAPRKIADNSTYVGGSACTSGSVKEVGVNSQQVWQTEFPVEKVKTRFAQAKVSSKPDNTVKTCKGSRGACANPGTAYTDINAATFSPEDGRDYFFEDTTQIQTKFFFKAEMTNRSVSRISSIDVCGAKVYLVSSFNNGNVRGVDNSSLLGLIANVGGKTLVLGNLSAQAVTPQGESPDYLRIPMHLADDDQIEKVMKSILGEGYSTVGEVIGSTERPVMGEIGGFPYLQKGNPGSASVRSVSRQ